eukprot:CAMPEP_0115851326 /NCGR_PEP_ID=MMETSP0287-20121206/12424_1 /TAXON_ID=412157 /ORGANISM="Chrysochromulina rotalis, Strain UIO044" /LENGTH=121 /DNA_ID=CAMNT_0003305355 /DNA_START=6 /DNA_END=371 /DNA_ORIENTATION=+
MDTGSSSSAPQPRAWPRYTLEDVAGHNKKEDCWIVVHDVVYDMTPHVLNHEGWQHGCKVSTLLAILSAMGKDCTDDFDEVHSDNAQKQMPGFQVGVLDRPNRGVRRIEYRSWEQLETDGVV